MYLRKEKVRSLTTTLFLITIALNLSCIIFEFLMPYGVEIVLGEKESNVLIGKIICRLYMFIAMGWDLVYLLYTCVNTYKISFFYDENKNRFNKKAIGVFAAIILCCAIFAFTFNIEYMGGINNSPYTIGGTIKYVFDVFTITGSAFILYVFARYSSKIRNING
jgi:hypothetical protein